MLTSMWLRPISKIAEPENIITVKPGTTLNQNSLVAGLIVTNLQTSASNSIRRGAVAGASSRSSKVKGESALWQIRTRGIFLSIGTHRLGTTVLCDMGDQKLSWPSFDIFKVIKAKGHGGFRILGFKFLLVSHSNYGSISHRLGAICGCRPLQRHQGHSRSKVKVPLDESGHGEPYVYMHP